MAKHITRRNMIAGCTASALVGVTGANMAVADEAAPFWMPQAWDRETDILVIGYGGAGAAAAIVACQEGLGDVLVLEAAPEGFEGGNTKVSGNLMFIPDTLEATLDYQTFLNGPYAIDNDVMQAWAEGIRENFDWVSAMGASLESMPFSAPEYPEVEGSEAVHTWCVDGEFCKPSLWNVLKAQEAELGFPVMYGTRATRLVFDPATREVLGAVAESDEGDVCIKARKGVVLACGGIENDPQMIRDYGTTGVSVVRPMGTPYNRGDGIRLVAPLGAQLWHMNAAAGNGYSVYSGGYDNDVVGSTAFGSAKDYIFVGSNAKRFMYEERIGVTRHGKVLVGGSWMNIPTPTPAWCIFGQTTFDGSCVCAVKGDAGWLAVYGQYIAEDNQGFLDAGVIFKGDTIEELAEKIGLEPETLAETVATYNGYCADGHDPDFGRGEEVTDAFKMFQAGEENSGKVAIQAFDLQAIEGPFYAIELVPRYLNTQGGAKRDASGNIVDYDGNPIPRLYGAGEFGCIYGYMYNGGGNVSEAIASGRLAARSIGALTPWDEA